MEKEVEQGKKYLWFKRGLNEGEIGDSKKYLKKYPVDCMYLFTSKFHYSINEEGRKILGGKYRKEIVDILGEDFNLFVLKNFRLDSGGYPYSYDKERRALIWTILMQKPEINILGELYLNSPKQNFGSAKRKLTQKGYSTGVRKVFEEVKGMHIQKSAPAKEEQTRTIFTDMKDDALRRAGYGFEPDWDTYDKACRLEEDDLDWEREPMLF